MAGNNRDGLIVLLAIAFLVSPVVYLVLQDGDSSANGLNQDHKVTIGERLSLYSDILAEDREYLVYLPGSYNDDRFTEQDYPVLYLLDGDAHFHSVSGVVQFLSEDANGTRRIPEMIIVAVPNTDRTRDLTPTHTLTGYDGEEQEFLTNSGGGDNFLRFLREELFAEIETDYRTLPHRTLVGHSFGGLAALHALVNAPGMFQNFIAIDPSLWWHEQMLVAQAGEAFVDGHDYRGSVYISLANNTAPDDDEPNVMEIAGREFAAILAAVNNESFSSSMRFYEDDDHGSVPLISLYDGLQEVFYGYAIDENRLADDPMYVIQHYEQVSDRLGINFPPPENGINTVGYYFLYALEDYEAAITVFSLNADLYPDSFNVYDSLGDGYRMNGDVELAIENYERSLELNPENDHAREQIAAMTESKEENEGGAE